MNILSAQELTAAGSAGLAVVMSIMHDKRSAADILTLENCAKFAQEYGLPEGRASAQLVMSMAAYVLANRTDEVLAMYRTAVLAAFETPEGVVKQ